MSKASILIVGSGPSGLALALALLKNGISVRIVERDAQHHKGSRGAGIQPRTLEIEHFLGILQEIKDQSMGVPMRNIYDPADPYRIMKSSVMIQYVEPTANFPICQPVMLNQSLHEAILRRHIASFGTQAELGTALVAMEQSEDGVACVLSKTADNAVTTEKATFDYVIGADGAHSTVRKLLGIPFLGETHESIRMYIADVVLHGIPNDGIHTWGSPDSVVLVVRHTGIPDHFQVISFGAGVDYAVMMKGKEAGTYDAVQELVTRATARDDIKISDVLWQSEWRSNARMVEHFRKGRVFIAGDAAHVHSPAGGQGLNSSIQDSFNLAWKLALVIKGHSQPALLDTYETERMPVIAEMLNLSTELLKKTISLFAKDYQGKVAEREDAWYRGWKLFQLDLNYRWSSVVLDERFENMEDPGADIGKGAYGTQGHDVRAGDRAPDAPGLVLLNGALEETDSETRLFDIFKPSLHTVLVIASGPNDAVAILTSLRKYSKGLVQSILALPDSPSPSPVTDNVNADHVVRDRDGHLLKGYGLTDSDLPKVVVIRPDGVVGAFVHGASGLERYFSRLFDGTSV